MKEIKAVIRHYKLEDVKNRLTDAGFCGMTVCEVRGFGRQRPIRKTEEYAVDFLPKVQITLLCNDGEVSQAVEAITEAARTGKVGDGVVWVTSVESYMRIRSGDTTLEHA